MTQAQPKPQPISLTATADRVSQTTRASMFKSIPGGANGLKQAVGSMLLFVSNGAPLPPAGRTLIDNVLRIATGKQRVTILVALDEQPAHGVVIS